jgi:hypothetical protein
VGIEYADAFLSRVEVMRSYFRDICLYKELAQTRVDVGLWRMPTFLEYRALLRQLEQKEQVAAEHPQDAGSSGRSRDGMSKELKRELADRKKQIDKLTKELFVEKSRRRNANTSFLESHMGKVPAGDVLESPEYQRLQQHCAHAEARTVSLEAENTNLRKTVQQLTEQLHGMEASRCNGEGEKSLSWADGSRIDEITGEEETAESLRMEIRALETIVQEKTILINELLQRIELEPSSKPDEANALRSDVGDPYHFVTRQVSAPLYVDNRKPRVVTLTASPSGTASLYSTLGSYKVIPSASLSRLPSTVGARGARSRSASPRGQVWPPMHPMGMTPILAPPEIPLM